MSKVHQQVRALTAVFEAAAQVDNFAAKGNARPEEYGVLIAAIFNRNPAGFDEVYPSSVPMTEGYNLLTGLLSGKPLPAQQRAIRLAFDILQLAKSATATPEALNRLAQGIESLTDTENVTDILVRRQLGALYQQTLSNLKFRVRVHGEPMYLQSEDIAASIRALLMAGVRAAFLWQQAGGSRWHLVFKRSSLMNAALEQIKYIKELQQKPDVNPPGEPP